MLLHGSRMEIIMREVRTRTKKRKKYGVIAIICVTLVLLALIGVAVLAAAAEADSDKIIRNVYVDGIRIGGMKTAEASAALEQELGGRVVTVRLGGEERTFTMEELGLSYKTDVLVGEAYALGKSDSFAENVATICRSFVLPRRLSSADAIISNGPGNAVMEFLDGFTLQPTESSFVIEGDRVVVTNGMNGHQADADALMALIGEAYDNEAVDVPVNTIPFELLGVDDIYTATATDPHPPYARNSDGSVTATVRTFNLDAAREIQKNNVDEGAVYEFIIDSESVAPLDDDSLYPEVIGEGVTEFDTSYTTRVNNIKIATELLNGVTLLPGEEFSFNDNNGDITTDRGYQVARGYSNGTVVDTVGAGVCQVSSTLYNAALFSGMEITLRSSHSLPVAYLPLGQDAAISYPVQDFKFKNSSSSPVKIFAHVDGGTLTVQLRGQNDGEFDEIKLEHSTLSVLEPKSREVVDSSLSPGQRIVKQRGSRGYVVESYRVFYKDGAVLKRENLGKSTYRAQDTVINVGRREVSEDE